MNCSTDWPCKARGSFIGGVSGVSPTKTQWICSNGAKVLARTQKTVRCKLDSKIKISGIEKSGLWDRLPFFLLQQQKWRSVADLRWPWWNWRMLLVVSAIFSLPSIDLIAPLLWIVWTRRRWQTQLTEISNSPENRNYREAMYSIGAQGKSFHGRPTRYRVPESLKFKLTNRSLTKSYPSEIQVDLVMPGYRRLLDSPELRR